MRKNRQWCVLVVSAIWMVSLSACAGLQSSQPPPLEMIAVLKSYIGVPYKKGGMSYAGIDCSGLAALAYASQGIDLPRTVSEMSEAGSKVKGDSFATGDLLFFNTKPLACVCPFRLFDLSIPLLYGQTHVGIYLEDGKFVHASASKGVIVSYIDSPYWQKRFLQARRILMD